MISRTPSPRRAARARWTVPVALALLLLAVAPRAWPVQAQTTRYVSPAGADVGNCSNSGSPCRSLGYAIGQSVAGDTISAAAGTYSERITINKALELRGAQYGVDPTAPGARTVPGAESILTEAGLSTPNPDVLVEVPNGVTDVVIDGFTLRGDPSNPTADTSTVRVWDDDVTIANNILEGRVGVLYKGAADLVVDHNRLTVNKLGVVLQPSPATGLQVTANVIGLGPAPEADSSAVYIAACSGCDVSGNTATGFSGRCIGGSSNANTTIHDNTLTSCQDGVSLWANTTFISIQGNTLAQSVRYGINLKGQDVTISGNQFTGSGDAALNVDFHTLATERIAIHCNNIAGSTNAGLRVGASVVATVDSEDNWWGAADGPAGIGPGSGDAVTGNADFDPWLVGPFETTPPCGSPLTTPTPPPTGVGLVQFTATAAATRPSCSGAPPPTSVCWASTCTVARSWAAPSGASTRR